MNSSFYTISKTSQESNNQVQPQGIYLLESGRLEPAAAVDLDLAVVLELLLLDDENLLLDSHDEVLPPLDSVLLLILLLESIAT